jgi:hypothetical protein
MKKKTRKLALHRETLRTLDRPVWMRNVKGGADTMHGACLTTPRACGTTGDDTGNPTVNPVCSGTCATGGACTATDTCASCEQICNH